MNPAFESVVVIAALGLEGFGPRPMGLIEMGDSGKRRYPYEPTKAVKCVVPAGRNQPCPCGSGKKYKRCCLCTTTS